MINLSLISTSKNEFQNALGKILQGPEYKSIRIFKEDYIQELKDYLSKMILNIIKKIISNMDTAKAVSGTLSTIFIIIGLLMIISIIILIVIKFNKTLSHKTKLREILGEKIDNRTSPKSLRSRGEAFANQDDYRQAIRFSFIALLLLMHEENLLYLDETKTNEEIYNYLKKSNFSKLMIFKALINDFNENWYGHKVWNKKLYNHWEENLSLIWNEVVYHENKK
ncbi:MAG TPA: hypothetical protein VIK72_16085 [Clostridiaceae bacterium]